MDKPILRKVILSQNKLHVTIILLGALCLCHISCLQYVLVADPIDRHWKWLTREATVLSLFMSPIANNYFIVKASTSSSPPRCWLSSAAETWNDPIVIFHFSGELLAFWRSRKRNGNWHACFCWINVISDKHLNINGQKFNPFKSQWRLSKSHRSQIQPIQWDKSREYEETHLAPKRQ